MIRSSALYMVIVIALVIAVICAALISSAGFYKLQYQRKFRLDKLQNNLISAQNLILESAQLPPEEKKVDLFNEGQDSVAISSYKWGLFDIGICRAFVQADTLTNVFSIAYRLDTAKNAALYIIDEDRPISVSGNNEITGNAYLPKAGIKEAYVDNQAYTGDKRIVAGKKLISKSTLPTLLSSRIDYLNAVAAGEETSLKTLPDSLHQSFLKQVVKFDLSKHVLKLTGHYSGHIFIKSDTLITIDSSAMLNQVIVCAPTIKVMPGFKGSCQLIASDSISIGAGSVLQYPSVIIVSRNKTKTISRPPNINIEKSVKISGIICCYDEQANNPVKPIVDLADKVVINGEIYTNGYFNYHKQIAINGTLYTDRLLYQSGYTRFENYLIGLKINLKKRSKYYLTSDLLPDGTKTCEILQWLN